MTRSLIARNALSALLLVLAVAGFFVKLREIQHGVVDATTRYVLAGYVVVALYAIASIGVRIRAMGLPRSSRNSPGGSSGP